ncbi:hypothetical protein NPIL_681021 [Nephila pilipes]|uniref:Uncharacterized protein n=1 Tax=Nephila pilipes TaxID=299642 RepID=A0A8X6TL08_NEPPI|nr:hypothetical protein NPIL_681021 [Nephila pilipes]
MLTKNEKWIKEGYKERLKPQISFIVKYREMLTDIDKGDSIDCLNILVSPLEYMIADHYLTLDDLTKKDNYDAILRATAIVLIEENYPELGSICNTLGIEKLVIKVK